MFRGPSGWVPIPAKEMLRRVAGLSRALGELGVKTGDRVGLLAANRPEWHIADFAILGLGAADVPIYFRESAERMTYILNHSGAIAAFVAGGEQAEKLMACRAQLKTVRHIIVADAETDYGSDALRYETLISTAGDADIAAYRLRAAEPTPDMLATIIYTSGTTGEPKGVMLTHTNLSSNASDSLSAADYSPKDIGLEFLPLAHVYERTLAYVYLFHGVSIAYVDAMEKVAQALLEVKPTLAGAVPRVFEKLYANIIEKGHRETGFRLKVFDWALRVAQDAVDWKAYGKSASFGLNLRWWVADKLVFTKIRAGVGGRLREFISGGAPLAKELAEFYWSIGLTVLQGYGLTETAPVISASRVGANKVGTVGKIIRNVEVRIAPDGEILTRGPNVMKGYYLRPEETAATISPDGWLATGDIGNLDADGFLTITDRKKELLKTAGGKYVAPQPIENSLKMSPFIQGACVVGDRRKFIVAILVPNFVRIKDEAAKEGRQFGSQMDIVRDPWVRDLIGREVERINSHLAQYETIKKFALLDKDFTFENGEVTYTMKLKRRVIEQRYADVIEQLYASTEEPRPIGHHVSED
ncbi:MAG TPA: long-chain fatty acid--CoA ligase [Candidatus Acidoferrum sp.]|nr:long-chain fatty acid--CoA ligase [Candidatus Acidoferrum sp.]